MEAPPQALHHPFDRQDINEHLVLFVDSSRTLARMALVCPAWWRAARRAAGYRLRALAGHTGAVFALAVLPGGQLASGSDDSTVLVWEVGSGRLVRTLAEHTGEVMALAVLPAGGLLASGSEDNTVRVWEVGSGRLVRTLAGHTGPVMKLAVLPGGLLASGSDDSTVRVWEVGSGRLVRALTGHTGDVEALAGLPGGLLATLRAGRRTTRCGCGRWRAAGWCERWPGTPTRSRRWRGCRGAC